ncbi:MAG: hypothetical protein ACPGLV_19445, partial [Bacteroidia bacterium]
MKLILIIITAHLTLNSCDLLSKRENANKNSTTMIQPLKNRIIDSTQNYALINRNYIDSILNDICKITGFELIELYPLVDSITSNKYENLILVDALKNR